MVNGPTSLHDENTPSSRLNGDATAQRPDYTSSRASSSLSIKRREEPSEYKLSGKLTPVTALGSNWQVADKVPVVNDSGVYLPVCYITVPFSMLLVIQV